MDLDKIDKKVQGWGLQLDYVEIEKILEHMLWDCISSDEFRRRCEFIFDDSEITLVWEEQRRCVTVRLENGKEITASV